MWVPSPKPELHSFFLVSSEFSLLLLDANKHPAEPIKLEHKPENFNQAYMGADGLLHVIEIVRGCMRWTNVDPASGKTVAAHHRHYWMLLPSKVLYHAGSSRVLGMADRDGRTMVVMDSDSLQEISRWSIAPHRPGVEPVQLAWSQTGSMLAVAQVAMFDPEDDPDYDPNFVDEIRVIETTSGNCLQKVSTMANTLDFELAWSPSCDVLAMYCWQKEDSAQGPDGDTESVYPLQARGFVTLLDPALSQAQIANCPRGEHLATGLSHFHGCKWSLCGELLLVPWNHGLSEEPRGYTVIDAHTLLAVYSCKGGCSKDLQWAQNMYLAPLPGSKLTRYLWGPGIIIRFCQNTFDQWSAHESQIGGLAPNNAAFLSPDCQTLVGLQQSSRRLVHLPQQSFWAEPQFVDPALAFDANFWSLAWAPFPSAWAPIYAGVCAALSEALHAAAHCPRELVLIDCKQHSALCRWNAFMLNTAVSNEAEAVCTSAAELYHAEWSSDGKHLAVHCDDCVFIVTFDRAPVQMSPTAQ